MTEAFARVRRTNEPINAEQVAVLRERRELDLSLPKLDSWESTAVCDYCKIAISHDLGLAESQAVPFANGIYHPTCLYLLGRRDGGPNYGVDLATGFNAGYISKESVAGSPVFRTYATSGDYASSTSASYRATLYFGSTSTNGNVYTALSSGAMSVSDSTKALTEAVQSFAKTTLDMSISPTSAPATGGWIKRKLKK